MRHAAPSLDHVDCIANEPVANATFCERPGPSRSQAHLSAFSSPYRSHQPPPGFWSVIVSEYSCPSTIVTPSSSPAVPALTKFSPQRVPMSGMYGRFVKATSPYEDGTLTLPLKPCQAQKP